ncbi:MAG: hypothetical protein NC302_07280 [Bacteroidales bacterium]|nr:hypothetical protein [Bacteroidales bacterium]MCM1415506.1 hypothetical protein [bacterium]MCM1424880.1 hypothetical protein [bacterium]
MELTQIGALQIAKQVNAILHRSGNYQGGNLEMTFVIDTTLQKEEMQGAVAAVAGALKRSDEIFRNVRLNLVFWGKEGMDMGVVPMAMLMTGGAFAEYVPCPAGKRYEDLFAYLKKFHARSRAVLVFADGGNEITDQAAAREALSPFLKNKLLLITDRVISGTQLFLGQ